MDSKTFSKKTLSVLKKDKTVSIPIYAYFNENVRELEMNTLTRGILEIEYTKPDGKQFKKRDLLKVQIYNRNALVWDSLNKLGSFMGRDDKVIIDFARKCLALAADKELESFPKDIVNAVKIIEGLKLYQIQYVKDPNAKYSTLGNRMIQVDYIQHPRETLLRKTGDCDDLTVLLASLFESIGISSAFVATKDHIFLLVEAKNIYNDQYIVKFQGKNGSPLRQP